MNNINNVKVVVRSIIGDSIDGVSRVTISADLYQKVLQSLKSWKTKERASLVYTRGGEQNGLGVYTFNFRGIELYVYKKPTGENFVSSFDGQEYPVTKAIFFMKTEDAKSHQMSIEEQRASEPKVNLDISKFNLDIIATA